MAEPKGLRGINTLTKRLMLSREDEAKVTGALVSEAFRVRDQARQRAPVLFGNLRASGDVLPPRILPRFGVEAVIKFGGQQSVDTAFPAPEVLPGGQVDYAVLRHSTSSSPYFLVNSFNSNVQNIYRALGTAFSVVLGGKNVAR